MTARVAVVGGTGFVGSAVARALTRRGADVVVVHAPRLAPRSRSQAEDRPPSQEGAFSAFVAQLTGMTCVVNCAGIPQATGVADETFYAANGALPGMVAAAAVAADTTRVVHVSSAVVQGRLPTLDDSSHYDAFSPYGMSKVVGEQTFSRWCDDRGVIYRPPSVHGPSRTVTNTTARLARSPMASVAAPATSPSPQALMSNVADAIAFLALSEARPPATVAHPWEGVTTGGLLASLGQRDPIVLPRWLARGAAAFVRTLARVVPAQEANARRLELLWFGQSQAPSWLTAAGWAPQDGSQAWARLGAELRASSTEGNGHA